MSFSTRRSAGSSRAFSAECSALAIPMPFFAFGPAFFFGLGRTSRFGVDSVPLLARSLALLLALDSTSLLALDLASLLALDPAGLSGTVTPVRSDCFSQRAIPHSSRTLAGNDAYPLEQRMNASCSNPAPKLYSCSRERPSSGDHGSGSVNANIRQHLCRLFALVRDRARARPSVSPAPGAAAIRLRANRRPRERGARVVDDTLSAATAVVLSAPPCRCRGTTTTG